MRLKTIAVSILLALFAALPYIGLTGGNASADSSTGSFDTCAAAGLGSTSAHCTQVTNCETNQTNAFNPSGNCLTALPKVASSDEQLQNGLKIVFGVSAGIALVSLAIGAFNYATVATDPEKISRAKQTIVLSLVGLIISISAEAIVLTVIAKL